MPDGKSRMRPSHGFGSLWHLAGRFFGSLVPVGPPKSAQGWAVGFLLPAEAELFEASSGADRRHAIGVHPPRIDLSTGTDGRPVDTPTRAFVAAALLHDVGEAEARLGTFGRVVATVAAVALRREKVLASVGHSPGSGTVRPLRMTGPQAVAVVYPRLAGSNRQVSHPRQHRGTDARGPEATH